MYRKLTKETINDFWKCWEKYMNDRMSALLGVCDDAHNYYVDYSITNMSGEDPFYIDQWLRDMDGEIEDFKRRELKKIFDSTGKFVVFLNELARLKFEKRYLNYECLLDLYALTWTWQKVTPEENFLVSIQVRWYEYTWDNKFKRSVKLERPQKLQMTEWIPD